MASDHTLALREAVVKVLRADAALTALVPVPQIYGEQPKAAPTWPFIRYGLPVTTAFEATGWDGSAHSVVIHAFAHGPGMDAVTDISMAISRALDNSDLDLGDLGNLGIDWQGSEVIRDSEEAGAYHAIVRFRATTVDPE